MEVYKLARGCCSHHGGASSCGSNGYYICNDGTQSPSCKCSNYELPKLYDSSDNSNNEYSCDYNDYEATIEELQNENQKLKNINDDLTLILGIMIIVIIIRYISKNKRKT